MANRHDDSSAKSMASGPLKIEKGTLSLLILATHRHTTESVGTWPWALSTNYAC